MDLGNNGGVVICVIGPDGSSHAPLTESALSIAKEIGRLIGERKGVLVTAGSGGILEAASEGANRAGGTVVGLLPGKTKQEANEYVTVPLATGLGDVCNPLVIRSSESVIMVAGDRTTLQQAIVAYGRKPLIVVEGTGGWADRLRQSLYDGQHFDERKSGGIIYVSNAEEAVIKAFELAKTFQPKEGLTISKVLTEAKKLEDPS